MNVTFSDIPHQCSPGRMERMKELGIKTSGMDKDMERLIKNAGYGLPSKNVKHIPELPEGSNEPVPTPRENYGFIFRNHQAYTRITLTYVDALAEELILLKELELI